MKASKVIAAFMAAGLFLTSTGCTSSKAKQKAAMEDALDSYVSKVLAGKDASKYVDAKEETAFTFFNERAEILSTVLDCSKFEITESEVDLKYKEGTVTIELKYPDAEEISESYFDIEFDEYLDEIREVKPNKTKKITIDFVLKDDDWLVTKKSDKKFKETLESLVANIELEPYNGGGSSDPVPDPGVVADPLAENKIGISMPTKDLMRWNSDGNMLKSQLESQGFNVDLQYASNDINTQISQIENQINQGCKVLIIAAISPESLSKVVEEAHNKGITVICYDRFITDAPVDYYVTFDNYAVGELQAEYIVNQLGLDSAPAGTTYNIEITAGDPSDMNAQFFYSGAMDVLQPYIDRGVLKVQSGQVYFNDVSTDVWSTEKAQVRAENIIGAFYMDGETIDAWLCSNDSTALGVTQALEIYYKGTYPIITGQDCDIANVKNIINGKQSMSVFKDTRTLVDRTVKMVKQIAEGQTIEINDTITFHNGYDYVNSYLCDPIFVDSNNYVEILIDSGYYTADMLK